MLNRNVGGIQLQQTPFVNKDSYDELTKLMSLFQAMQQQKEAARKDRLEELRYKEFERKNRNDERNYQSGVKREIEREMRYIIANKANPLIKSHREDWQKHQKLLNTGMSVIKALQRGQNQDSNQPAYWDSSAISNLDRFIEQMTGASRVSTVHEGELRARIASLLPWQQQLINKWHPVARGKKILSQSQSEEFIDSVLDEIQSKHENYKSSYKSFGEDFDAVKSLISPNYQKYLPTVPKSHEADPVYAQYEQMYKDKQERQKAQQNLLHDTLSNSFKIPNSPYANYFFRR